MIVELALVLGPLAGLGEGERATAHLVLGLTVLVGLAALGLVYLIRRRRRDQTRERDRTPEEH
jgi:hypothetical protein